MLNKCVSSGTKHCSISEIFFYMHVCARSLVNIREPVALVLVPKSSIQGAMENLTNQHKAMAGVIFS